MNIDWAKQWLASFGDLDRMMEMYAENVKFEDIIFGEKANNRTELRHFSDAFSDPKVGTHRFRADGYSGGGTGGAVEWTWFAEHGGDFFGIPAKGRKTETRGASVLSFSDGKIVAQHDLWDAAAIFKQLGVGKLGLAPE